MIIRQINARVRNNVADGNCEMLANSMKDCLIVRFVKVNFQMNGRWLILLHCQNVNPPASIYNDIQPITCDVLAIYDNNI